MSEMCHVITENIDLKCDLLPPQRSTIYGAKDIKAFSLIKPILLSRI